MAKFRVGQSVYAPIYRYAAGRQAPFAIARGTVRAVTERSCEVDLPYGIGIQRIASSLLHADVGVCVVRIGDFRSELSTMDPICKSLLNFLRLLLPDDQIKSVGIRTVAELEEVFEIFASAYPLWIIVGHGTEAGQLCFTRSYRTRSRALAKMLAPHASAPKTFLFLSCHTGRAAFARPFSEQPNLCHVIIGPTGALHSALACQFAQTFLSYLYLEGRHTRTAFKKATAQTLIATNFRLWQRGTFS